MVKSDENVENYVCCETPIGAPLAKLILGMSLPIKEVMLLLGKLIKPGL